MSYGISCEDEILEILYKYGVGFLKEGLVISFKNLHNLKKKCII